MESTSAVQAWAFKAILSHLELDDQPYLQYTFQYCRSAAKETTRLADMLKWGLSTPSKAARMVLTPEGIKTSRAMISRKKTKMESTSPCFLTCFEEMIDMLKISFSL